MHSNSCHSSTINNIVPKPAIRGILVRSYATASPVTNLHSPYGEIVSPIKMTRIFLVDIRNERNDNEFVSDFDKNAYKAADLIH